MDLVMLQEIVDAALAQEERDVELAHSFPKKSRGAGKDGRLGRVGGEQWRLVITTPDFVSAQIGWQRRIPRSGVVSGAPSIGITPV
jgi:hypothetical protein